MIARLEIATPHEAVREMIAAGAVFSMGTSLHGLGRTFSYRVKVSGDAQRCADILTAVKDRPPVFFAAFKVHVQDTVSATLGAA